MKSIGISIFILVVAASALALIPAHVLVDERHAAAHYALHIDFRPLAATFLRPLASIGDARALNNLGALYFHGAGVARNLETARLYFERAAEKGSSRARLNLAMLRNGGCGTNVPTAAQTAAALQPLVPAKDPAAARHVLDCFYFAATEQTLADRDQRMTEAGTRVQETNDPQALLHAGWALLNLARTTQRPEFGNTAEETDYERRVTPIARKAMEVLFAAAAAGATGAYEPIGILMMQFGDSLGDGPLAVRLREKSNWEWIEEGAARGDWEAQCKVVQATITHLRWDGRDYSRQEFDTAVKEAHACIDRKEETRTATWYSEDEWLTFVPRHSGPKRPVLEIHQTEAALNGLIFFDADKQLGATRTSSDRAPGILVRGAQ